MSDLRKPEMISPWVRSSIILRMEQFFKPKLSGGDITEG
jgi:hypothetical protein